MFDILRKLPALLSRPWRAIRSDRGATVIEYALMALGGIAIAAILVAAITAFTQNHSDAIQNTK